MCEPREVRCYRHTSLTITAGDYTTCYLMVQDCPKWNLAFHWLIQLIFKRFSWTFVSTINFLVIWAKTPKISQNYTVKNFYFSELYCAEIVLFRNCTFQNLYCSENTVFRNCSVQKFDIPFEKSAKMYTISFPQSSELHIYTYTNLQTQFPGYWRWLDIDLNGELMA